MRYNVYILVYLYISDIQYYQIVFPTNILDIIFLEVNIPSMKSEAAML